MKHNAAWRSRLAHGFEPGGYLMMWVQYPSCARIYFSLTSETRHLSLPPLKKPHHHHSVLATTHELEHCVASVYDYFLSPLPGVEAKHHC